MDHGTVAAIPTDTQTLSELLRKLEEGMPRTNMMRMLIKNIMDGSVQANLYTDSWPEFTTVVGQIFLPKMSKIADIVAYSTSKTGLLSVMEKPGLVTWDKYQVFQALEETDAQYLIENLKPPGESRPVLKVLFRKSTFYYPKLLLPDVPCPPGFIPGKLLPQHSKHITTYWDPLNLTPYAEGLIQNCESMALFQEGDLQNPVAWELRHPYGYTAHFYVMEEHRRKGLGSFVHIELCRKIIAKGDFPECATDHDGTACRLLRKFGFVESHSCMSPMT